LKRSGLRYKIYKLKSARATKKEWNKRNPKNKVKSAKELYIQIKKK
jgi:hypothetical protein